MNIINCQYLCSCSYLFIK